MQRNKYLDDLGIPIKEYGLNFTRDNDKRQETWDKEREEYGFDSRETWNLDITFVEWLYSRLMMYKEKSIVDLNYPEQIYVLDDKEYTFGAAIDFILERLKFFLIKTYRFESLEIEKEAYKKVTEATKMWTEIWSACWW